ncbi:MAG: hypothetical protein UV28_C0008G0016 [Candidatus Collierbacteria bacterium GW2011_GWE2_42_48]|nr:MAG: hypothetical protein UV28_C0008G0016 [Candidatus Collierbacteria bacterium GW2011_GWE2_42_48]
MSIKSNYTKIPNNYIYDPELTASEFRVLAAFLSFSWGNNASFPTQDTVSKRIGVSTRAIRYSLETLSKKGYIDYKRRGFNKSNQYNFPTLGKDSSQIKGSPLPANKTINNTSNYLNEEETSKGMESIRETLKKKGIFKKEKL